METKQPPSVFALIVDKLRYMDETELKLAYMKLFRRELKKNGMTSPMRLISVR